MTFCLCANSSSVVEFLISLRRIFHVFRPKYRNAFKDTHLENIPSNKTEALTRSMHKNVWAISTLNQLFIRGF